MADCIKAGIGNGFICCSGSISIKNVFNLTIYDHMVLQKWSSAEDLSSGTVVMQLNISDMYSIRYACSSTLPARLSRQAARLSSHPIFSFAASTAALSSEVSVLGFWSVFPLAFTFARPFEESVPEIPLHPFSDFVLYSVKDFIFCFIGNLFLLFCFFLMFFSLFPTTPQMYRPNSNLLYFQWTLIK